MSVKFIPGVRVQTAVITTLALLFGLLGPLAVPRMASAATAIACSDQAIGTALAAGGDYTFACGPNPVTIVMTSRTVTKNVSFNGGNFISLSGNNANRFFTVNPGVTLTLRDITLRNGKYTLSAGAISNLGTLNLTHVTLTDNTAQQGGAILNGSSGIVTMANSTISNNHTTVNGGGIFNSGGSLTVSNSVVSGNQAGTGGGIYTSGNTTITDSTISGNSATTAGGIAVYPGTGKTVTISNSTVTGNSASGASGGGGLYVFTSGTLNNVTISSNTTGGSGGGIRTAGVTNLNGVTIANNTAVGSGGGLYAAGTVTNLANTLIAGNTGAGSPDCYSTMTKLASQGYNLVGDLLGCPLTGDPTGNVTDIDPLLGALANNGGPTMTHAISSGSPAINAGNPATAGGASPACNATDGRGVSRTDPAAGRCDIGAYETQGSPPVMKKPAATLVQGTLGSGSNGAARVKVKWSATDPDGIAGYEVQQQINTGGWTGVTLADPADTQVIVPLATASSYQFRARATDLPGAVSPYKAGAAFTLLLVQEAGSGVTKTGAWATETLSGSSGGSVRWSQTAGASVTFSTTSARGLAWVTTKGPDRGKAQVYIDGALTVTIDLYAPTYQTRQVVFVANNLAVGAHTLEVRALGTHRPDSIGSRVDVDGFVILR